MFEKILIANRGEIACRVARAARALGVKTVAVYSDADADALHLRAADEAVRLGPAPARESYLDGEKVIAAAKRTGARAIHPGYGFLSEQAEFAQACAENDLVFVGPPPGAMRAIKDKAQARSVMRAAGVPVVPGSEGHVGEEVGAKAAAASIGYPLLVKAAAGGGGIGMQVEHPVTEATTGLDLVQLQLRIAAGEKLPLGQDDLRPRGHAIECRINAEDPVKFFPSPGPVKRFDTPVPADGALHDGIRIDAGYRAGDAVTPYYDSLLAKVISFAETRDGAIARMRHALERFAVEGVKTNIPTHLKVFASEAFARGELDTHFLERL